MDEEKPEEKAEETPPIPREKAKRESKMVNVYNSHKYKSFHLGGGRKIKPGSQMRIASALFKSVEKTCPWLKRAERGDVI
jgi:hypothetical protein